MTMPVQVVDSVSRRMPSSVGHRGVWAAFLIATAGLGACQSSYSADVTNKTPQPLFVQLFAKGSGQNNATLAQSRRLGPGDRGGVGPIRVETSKGAYVVFDTKANPGRPVTVDLAPGANLYEVRADGTTNDAPLVIIQK
jgi:hypothetical protein